MNYYIPDINLHRNETTFRHLITCQDQLARRGIVRVFNPDEADIMLIGQATLCDKKLSLDDSTAKALTILRDITRPYAIFDGQDSTSLKGIAEIVREVRYDINFRGVFKNSLTSWHLYKRPNISGRWYWGVSDDPEVGYDIPDIDELQQYIHLSETNWLGTLTHQLQRDAFKPVAKAYDVCALFSYEMVNNTEYGLDHSEYYNAPRRELLERLKRMNIRLVYNEPGKRHSLMEYYAAMRDSKCVIAPFGFGEMAPRDVECAFMGTALLKPSMDNVRTIPQVYQPGRTYIPYTMDNVEDVVASALFFAREDLNAQAVNMVKLFKKAFNANESADRFANILERIAS